MNTQVINGRIDITDNIILIRDIIDSLDTSTIIINLDEDNKLIGKQVVQGTILLPPPEAMMAEQDGDEIAYDTILFDYYNTRDLQLYVTGIINTLHNGLNILFYYPNLNPAESVTVPKLLSLFWNMFGLGIGIIGVRDCVYNYSNIPLWLNMLYNANAIDPYEYLTCYPLDINIMDQQMSKLIYDLRPVDTELKDKRNTIYRLRKRLHEHPETKMAMYQL